MTDVEELVVQGVGGGEGEPAVESGEGDITLEVEGGETEFEVRQGDGSTGEEEEAGEGGVEG